MEILIGREPVNSRLLVSVGGKATALGTNGSVPNSVSRHINGSAHCVITYNSDNDISIKNVKEQNITYVDGNEIQSKKITLSSKVELGNTHFIVNVQQIVNAAKQLAGVAPAPPKPGSNAKPADVKTFSLRPLEQIWDTYEKDILDLQVEQAKKATQSRLQGILSMSATLCAFLPVPDVLRFVILAAALTCAVVCFWQGAKTSDIFAVKKNKRDKQFQQDYVCPNPACKCFKGNVPYISLRNMPNCSVCKCNYTS